MDSSEAAAFDGLAQDYDAEFTATVLGQELRARVWKRLAAVFAGRERILELGCGTGEDAVWLARAGHRVVATDASPEMIRVARLKAIAAGCADLIEFHCVPMESLDWFRPDGRLDAVFSNFGAVNCVADLPRLSRTLAMRLPAGSPLVFVVMGRHVPWEWAWYLARGDSKRAFRRFSRGGAEWRGLTIRYPAPRTLTRSLAPGFITRRATALGFALPPSYASAWVQESPALFAGLKAIENATSRFTAGLADHYILEASRA